VAAALQASNPGLQCSCCGDKIFLSLGHPTTSKIMSRDESKQQLSFRRIKKCSQAASGDNLGVLEFRQHSKFCTPQAVQHPSDLACPICMHSDLLHQLGVLAATFSEHQLTVMVWCGELLPAGSGAYEAKAVPGWHAAVDIYIPGIRLIVQVDGEQHFWKEMKTKSVASQQQQDVKFNCVAWQSCAAAAP